MKIVDSFTGRMKSKPVDLGLEEVSMESSSIYTSSIKKGCKLLPISEGETEEKNKNNDDEQSRGSTIDTRKSYQMRLMYFKRSTKETFYSTDEGSLHGNSADYEDYDIADIEKQLQGIKVSNPLLKSDARQLKKYDNDPLEQVTAASFSDDNEFVSSEFAKKFRCIKVLVFVSCVFFLVSTGLVLVSALKESSAPEPKASPHPEHNILVFPMDTTVTPTFEWTVEPTMAPIQLKTITFQSKLTLAPTLEDSMVLLKDELRGRMH
jgi:hypothetical protein